MSNYVKINSEKIHWGDSKISPGRTVVVYNPTHIMVKGKNPLNPSQDAIIQIGDNSDDGYWTYVERDIISMELGYDTLMPILDEIKDLSFDISSPEFDSRVIDSEVATTELKGLFKGLGDAKT